MKRVVALIGLATACSDGGTALPRPDAMPPLPPDAMGAPVEVTFTLVDRGAATSSNADLLVFRDGNGGWQALRGEGGVYTATTHGRFAVFIGCIVGGAARFEFATGADGPDFTWSSCAPAVGATVTLAGSIAGSSPGSEFVEVSANAAYDYVSDLAYAVEVAPGPVDLLAVSTRYSDYAPAHMLRRTYADVTVDTTSTLDFADGAPPIPTTFALDGRAALDAVTVTGQLRSMRLDAVTSQDVPDDSDTFFAIPDEVRQPDDVVTLWFDATQPHADFELTRGCRVDDGAGAVACALPTLVNFEVPAVREDNGATFTWTMPSDVTLPSDAALSAYAYHLNETFQIVYANATAAWRDGATSFEFGTLDGVPGWDAAWELPAIGTRWSIGLSSPSTGARAGSRGTVGAGVALTTPRDRELRRAVARAQR